MVLTIDFEGGYGFFQTRQKSYSFTFVFAGMIFFFFKILYMIILCLWKWQVYDFIVKMASRNIFFFSPVLLQDQNGSPINKKKKQKKRNKTGHQKIFPSKI